MKLYTNGQIIQPSEVDFLELEGYEVVKSYSKLDGSNWYKYTAKQQAFYEENPNATPLEVYNMKVEVYTPTLEDFKKQKVAEIYEYDSSDNVNGFYLNGLKVWLNKETRVGLVNLINRQVADNRTDTTLWLGSISLHMPCDLALNMLTKLEVYAGDCYNMTRQHEYNVNEVTSNEDVLRYDFTVGYPVMPEFNIPVE